MKNCANDDGWAWIIYGVFRLYRLHCECKMYSKIFGKIEIETYEMLILMHSIVKSQIYMHLYKYVLIFFILFIKMEVEVFP